MRTEKAIATLAMILDAPARRVPLIALSPMPPAPKIAVHPQWSVSALPDAALAGGTTEPLKGRVDVIVRICDFVGSEIEFKRLAFCRSIERPVSDQ